MLPRLRLFSPPLHSHLIHKSHTLHHRAFTSTASAMAPKIAIIMYSMYGHIKILAEEEKKGVEAAGGQADIFQVPETLPAEVLEKMHAPPKDSSIKTLGRPDELVDYDGFLIGIPTRYGNMPAQLKAFWDSTGQLWQQGKFHGKFAGTFVSNSSPGGGQEVTHLSVLSTFAHHGIIYVPLGYAPAFAQLSNMDEVRGGSAWGAGTFTGGTGARLPSDLEKEIARIQGTEFAKTVGRKA